MIKVNKNGQPPQELLCDCCKEQIRNAVENRDGSKYTNKYYRCEEVLKLLKEDIYKNKCAYCESYSEHVTALQVEHYRPKNGLDEKDSAGISHKGYYWLGNEWTNLLLSCPKCNGKGAKGTRFPISGKRVVDGSPFIDKHDINSFNRTQLIATNPPLIDEEPLLLNPEHDEPKEHLDFDIYGKMLGISERGKVTIDICKLNRQPLIDRRQDIINNFLKHIKCVILAFADNKINENAVACLLETTFDEILENTKSESEYTLWGRFIFEKFEEFILNRITPYYQDLIRKEFNNYCNGLPDSEKNF